MQERLVKTCKAALNYLNFPDLNIHERRKKQRVRDLHPSFLPRLYIYSLKKLQKLRFGSIILVLA